MRGGTVSENEDKEESEGRSGELTSPSGLNHGEERVVHRLQRARQVANLAVPELVPTLDDLVEIAEMIEDEGG